MLIPWLLSPHFWEWGINHGGQGERQVKKATQWITEGTRTAVYTHVCTGVSGVLDLH